MFSGIHTHLHGILVAVYECLVRMGEMLSKFLIFYLVYRLTGNPIIAIVVILAVYYWIDRRYVGLLPNLWSPIRRSQQIAALRRQVAMNAHDAPGKIALARLYMARKKFPLALQLFHDIPESMRDTAPVKVDMGQCLLHLGNIHEGEALILSALQDNPTLRYGEPWLHVASAVAPKDPEKAIEYLEMCRKCNSSSCETEYRMGQLLLRLGDVQGAREARERCLTTYRLLPRARKRTERRWAILAFFRTSSKST